MLRIGCKWRKPRSRRWSRSCVEDRSIPWIKVLQHYRMALVTLSLFNESWGSVLPFTILFAVFIESSALILDWGYATEDSLCFTYHVFRSWLEVKGGSPSLLSSCRAQYVWNSHWQVHIYLKGVIWPAFRGFKISQPVSLHKWDMQSVRRWKGPLLSAGRAILGMGLWGLILKVDLGSCSNTLSH